MKHKIVLLVFILLIYNYTVSSQSLKKDEITDSIYSILQEKKIPGIFIAVISADSTLIQQGIGYADLSTKEQVSNKHLFKIGSVTKTFTALAILKLIDQGKLNLEDKLIDIAPEISFTNPWKESHPVKIKHLLEHKAGFDDMHLNTITKERTKGMNAYAEVMAFKRSLKSRWQPGLVHSYSNPGYTILGYIIEKVSNQPYQVFIRKNITEPLKMRETHFISQSSKFQIKHNFSKGYERKDSLIQLTIDKTLIGEAAGALYSNADNMTRFARLFLNPKAYNSQYNHSEKIIKEMETLHSFFETQNAIKEGYGLGIYNNYYGTDNIKFKGHSGGIHGFSTNFIYSRDQDRAIIVSNNLGAGNRAIINLLVDQYCTPSKETKPHQNKFFTKQNIKEWAGHYKILNTRNKIADAINAPLQNVFVTSTNDSLSITPFFEESDTYYPISNNRYQSVLDSSNNVYLTTHNGQKSIYFYEDLLVPISRFKLYSQRLLLLIGLSGGVVSLLILIIAIITSIFKKRRHKWLKYLFYISLPYCFIFITFLLFLQNLSLDKLPNLGNFSITSCSIFISSLLIFVSTANSIYHGYKMFRNSNLLKIKTFAAWSVLGAIILTTHLIIHGWIGIQVWAY